MVHGVEGEAEQSTLHPELDVLGVDDLPCELPVLLHDVVPVVGELKAAVWVGCKEHLLM